MIRPSAALFVLAAALAAYPLPAPAQFEGRLEYQMKGPHGAGTITVWAGAAGARTEFSKAAAASGTGSAEDMPADFHFTALWRRDDPDHLYMVNDARKVYAVLDMNKDKEETPRIERVGTSRVAGYSCQRVRITANNGQAHELCITDQLGDFSVPLGASARSVALWSELRHQGLSGVPVSWTDLDPQQDERSSIVLTSAEKQRVPASRFAVPTGYTRSSAIEAFASPAQQQKMQEMLEKMKERMKDMSPEQRQKLEEMMKRYQN